VTKRIGDLQSNADFLRTPLYNEYYRSIRIDHVMALPIHVDEHMLVSFVFNRSRRDFSDRERARVDLIRPHLGVLYRLSLLANHAQPAPTAEQLAALSPVAAHGA
jgi:hypothetical protein